VVALSYKDIKIKTNFEVFKPIDRLSKYRLTSKQLRFIIYSDLYQRQINEIIKGLKPLDVEKEYNAYCFMARGHLYETYSLNTYIDLNMHLGLFFRRSDRYYSIFDIEEGILEFMKLKKINFNDSLISDD
jgi:hypothetical protein